MCAHDQGSRYVVEIRVVSNATQLSPQLRCVALGNRQYYYVAQLGVELRCVAYITETDYYIQRVHF